MNDSSSSFEDEPVLDEALRTCPTTFAAGDKSEKISASDSLFATCPNFKSIENFRVSENGWRLSKSMYSSGKNARWIKSTGPRNGRSSSLERLDINADDMELVTKLREEEHAVNISNSRRNCNQKFGSCTELQTVADVNLNQVFPELVLPIAPAASTFGLTAQWNTVMHSVLAACTPREEEFASEEQKGRQVQAVVDENSLIDDISSEVEAPCETPRSPLVEVPMEMVMHPSSVPDSEASCLRDEIVEFIPCDAPRSPVVEAPMETVLHPSSPDDSEVYSSVADEPLEATPTIKSEHSENVGKESRIACDVASELALSDVEMEPTEIASAVKIVSHAMEGGGDDVVSQRSPDCKNQTEAADDCLRVCADVVDRPIPQSASCEDPFHTYWERAVDFFKELQSKPDMQNDGASCARKSSATDEPEAFDITGTSFASARAELVRDLVNDALHPENAVESACPSTRPQTVDETAFRGTASLLAALVVTHVIEEAQPGERRRQLVSTELAQHPSRPNTREAAERVYWDLANDVLQEAQTKRQPSKNALGTSGSDKSNAPDEVMVVASHVANELVTETCRFFNEVFIPSRQIATPGASTVVSTWDEQVLNVPESSEVATLLGQALCASALDIEARSTSKRGTLSMEFESAMQTSLPETNIGRSRLQSPDVQSVARFTETGHSSLGLSVTGAALTRALDTFGPEGDKCQDPDWAISVKQCSQANNTLTEKALHEALNQRRHEGSHSDDGFGEWGRPCSFLASPQPASTFSGSSLAFSRTGTLHSFFSKKRSAEISSHLPTSQSTEIQHTSEDASQDDKLGKVFRLSGGEWNEAQNFSPQDEAISFALSPGEASHLHTSSGTEPHDSMFLLQALQGDPCGPCSGRPPLPPDVALGSTSRSKFRQTAEMSSWTQPEDNEPPAPNEMSNGLEADEQIEEEEIVVVNKDHPENALQVDVEDETLTGLKESDQLEDFGETSQSPSASVLGSPSPASTMNRSVRAPSPCASRPPSRRGSDSPVSSRPPSRRGSGSPESSNRDRAPSPSSSRPPSRRGSASSPSSRPPSASGVQGSDTSTHSPSQLEPSVLQLEPQAPGSVAMEFMDVQNSDEVEAIEDGSHLALQSSLSQADSQVNQDVEGEVSCSTILAKSGLADASDIQLVKEQLSSLFALDNKSQVPALSTLFEETQISLSQTTTNDMAGQISYETCQSSYEGQLSPQEMRKDSSDDFKSAEQKASQDYDSAELSTAAVEEGSSKISEQVAAEIATEQEVKEPEKIGARDMLTHAENMLVPAVLSGELSASEAINAALAMRRESAHSNIYPLDLDEQSNSGSLEHKEEQEITYEVLVGNAMSQEESTEEQGGEDNRSRSDEVPQTEAELNNSVAEGNQHKALEINDKTDSEQKVKQEYGGEADQTQKDVSPGVGERRVSVVSNRSRKSSWADLLAEITESPNESLANTRERTLSDEDKHYHNFAFSDLDSLAEYYGYVAKRTLLRDVLQIWQQGMAVIADEAAAEAIKYISSSRANSRRNSTVSVALSRRNSATCLEDLCRQSSPIANISTALQASNDDDDDEDGISEVDSEDKDHLRPWEVEKQNAAGKMLRHFWALHQGSGEKEIAQCLWAHGKLNLGEAPRRALPRSGSRRPKPTAEEIAAREERKKQILANHLASKPPQDKQAAWDIDASPKPSPRAIYRQKPPITEPPHPADLFPTKWCTKSLPALIPLQSEAVPSASCSAASSARRNAPASLPKLPAKRNRMSKSHSQPPGTSGRPVVNAAVETKNARAASKESVQHSARSGESKPPPMASPLPVTSARAAGVAGSNRAFVHVDPKGDLTNAKAEGEFPSYRQAASIYAKSVDVASSVSAAHARQRMKSTSLPAIKVRQRGKPAEPPRMWRAA